MAKKIPVSAPQAPLATPFAGLELSGLPPGPVEPESGAGGSGEVENDTLPGGKLGRVAFRKEKSGRSGKTVTVAFGFLETISEGQLERLAREARQALGCGGTLSGREIELQGDVVDRARVFFAGRGFRVGK